SPTTPPLLAEIRQLETRLLELGDDYDARVIDRTEWLHRRGRLQERLAALRAQIATNTQHAVLDSVDLAGDWDTMGFDRKRAILAVVRHPLPTCSLVGSMEPGNHHVSPQIKDRPAVVRPGLPG